MNDDAMLVDPDLLRKHGLNLEERLSDLRSAPESEALRPSLNSSDFGNTQDAEEAARSYAEASDALHAALVALVGAGLGHARAIRASAAFFRRMDEENAARIPPR